MKFTNFVAIDRIDFIRAYIQNLNVDTDYRIYFQEEHLIPNTNYIKNAFNSLNSNYLGNNLIIISFSSLIKFGEDKSLCVDPSDSPLERILNKSNSKFIIRQSFEDKLKKLPNLLYFTADSPGNRQMKRLRSYLV
ncbi:hypothetical protein J4403_02675 [Candidatus Woesearchaeota archaeon]|nr:hypothetical protein [Candidatus Woesearchaeota archaeon]